MNFSSLRPFLLLYVTKSLNIYYFKISECKAATPFTLWHQYTQILDILTDFGSVSSIKDKLWSIGTLFGNNFFIYSIKKKFIK